jgi:hypothetical protein
VPRTVQCFGTLKDDSKETAQKGTAFRPYVTIFNPRALAAEGLQTLNARSPTGAGNGPVKAPYKPIPCVQLVGVSFP